MPESWNLVRGSEAFTIQQGQIDPKTAPFSMMPHIGPENIESNTGRLLALKTNVELGISSGNYLFSAEHVVYSKIRPYLNKAAFPRFQGTCSADMYPLLPDKSHFSTEFIFQYLLSSSFVKQASSHQDRTGIPKINRNQLNSVLLPKPDLPEQDLISGALSDCDKKLDIHIRMATSLRALFRTLLHQLMTAKVRVRDLDLSALEEPSAELAEVT